MPLLTVTVAHAATPSLELRRNRTESRIGARRESSKIRSNVWEGRDRVGLEDARMLMMQRTTVLIATSSLCG